VLIYIQLLDLYLFYLDH